MGTQTKPDQPFRTGFICEYTMSMKARFNLFPS